MKIKLFLIFLLLTAAIAGQARAQTEFRPLLPAYWIFGMIADTQEAAPAGLQTIPVGNLRVYFYRDANDFAAGNYALATVKNNWFSLNAFNIYPAPLVVGRTYIVATERDEPGYGAGGTVAISGKGWDEVTGLVLARGGGVLPPDVALTPEPAPKMAVKFGNHLYQKAVLAAGQKFVVSDKPKIQVDFSIAAPYAVSNRIEDYSMVLNPGKANSRSLQLSASNMSSQSFAVAGDLKSFSLVYTVQENEKLSDGENVIQIQGRSSGMRGLQTLATELATVEVAGGPLRVIGQPLAYPSPFRLRSDKNILMQYVLNRDAEVEVSIYSIEGRMVKKFFATKGTEGGAAGLNNLYWDVVTESGDRAGAAIYLGSIVSREEGRLLARFRIVIVE